MGIEPPEIEMASSSSIVQIVAIPSDAITATLSFWAWRGTEESGGSGELAGVKWRPSLAGVNLDALTYDDDVQEIILFTQDAPGDPWDTVLQEVEREKRTDAGWVESSYDLTPHVGKSVMLYINVFNDGSDGRTWMYVDDVSLEICR